MRSSQAATRALSGLRSLHLFGGVRSGGPAHRFVSLLSAAAEGNSSEAATAYGAWFGALAGSNWAGDSWRCELAECAAGDANPFTLSPAPGPGLVAAAASDLAAIQAAADPELQEAIREDLQRVGYAAHPPLDLGSRPAAGFAARLAAAPDWGAMAPDLHAAVVTAGVGVARAWALRWDGTELVPVHRPDIPSPEGFVGYRAQRQTVYDNTERFMRGIPANDVLLYGDRGTGKSSTVRSLLARHGEAGLRLVEFGRRWLPGLPRLFDALTVHRQRFIVFIDDLSFEEDEAEYKEAKATLQGGLTARPPNVLIYATSNSRHLIRERMSDRPDPILADNPRARDATDETLSLADRFAITVVFTAPDQELYLEIVRGLCAQRGISLPPDALRAQALRWAAWYNGWSARSAQQFVTALCGPETTTR